MKKVIAILSVLAIMACAFAVDPQPGDIDALKVTTKIKSQEPIFILSSEITANVTDAAATTTYSQYKEASGTTAAVDPTAVTKGDANIIADKLLDANQTVSFTISQKTLARSNFKYTLTVTATDLVHTEPKSTTAADNEIFEVLDDTGKIVIAPKTMVAKDKVALSATNNVMTAIYTGKVSEKDTKLDLATFSVTWTNNTEARVGDYLGYVILTIETDELKSST